MKSADMYSWIYKKARQSVQQIAEKLRKRAAIANQPTYLVRQFA